VKESRWRRQHIKRSIYRKYPKKATNRKQISGSRGLRNGNWMHMSVKDILRVMGIL
jgi:hypothetical protein